MPKTITIEVPDGYKAVQTENGYKFEPDNELPKTWEECLKRLNDKQPLYSTDRDTKDGSFVVLNDGENERYEIEDEPDLFEIALPSESTAKAMINLCKLLIARDVYRDGWEPDWTDDANKYIIYFYDGEIEYDFTPSASWILSFQTAEIRDLFSENFKDLIEEAKELL